MKQNVPLNTKANAIQVRTNLMAGEITIYGQDSCKWTLKQKDYLNDKGISFNYIDCNKQSCPASVTAFPTIVMDGITHTGYKEI